MGAFSYRLTWSPDAEIYPAHVHLILAEWINVNGDDAPYISPQLMTDIEIDEQVALLKDQLDAAGRNAKAALKKRQG